MAYNLTCVRYLDGELTIDPADAQALLEEHSPLPEDCFLRDAAECVGDDVPILQPSWCGEWSGTTYETFMLALAHADGRAQLLLVWEGGDKLTGLKVRDGVVAECDVTVKLTRGG